MRKNRDCSYHLGRLVALYKEQARLFEVLEEIQSQQISVSDVELLNEEIRAFCRKLLHQIAALRQIARFPRRPAGRPKSTLDVDEIKRQHEMGVGVTRLAETFQVSRQTIYRVLGQS